MYEKPTACTQDMCDKSKKERQHTYKNNEQQADMKHMIKSGACSQIIKGKDQQQVCMNMWNNNNSWDT